MNTSRDMQKLKNRPMAHAKELEIELYVAEDIIQGEKEVPFYMLWKGVNVEKIQFKADGFEAISRLYNVRNPIGGGSERLVKRSSMELPGYVGGSLSTKQTKNPFLPAKFEAVLTMRNGQTETLTAKRILHTTRVKVEVPDEIALPLQENDPRVDIQLQGMTTVFMDIEETESSQIELVLPDEVKSAAQKFILALVDGFGRLKTQFPEHADLIDMLVNPPETPSLRRYFDDLLKRMKEVRDNPENREFKEAFAMVAASSLIAQSGLQDTLILPLIEYFESNATSKAFFRSPLICAKVPKGGGVLEFTLSMVDLLNNRIARPIPVAVSISSSDPCLLPIKDFITARRTEKSIR